MYTRGSGNQAAPTAAHPCASVTNPYEETMVFTFDGAIFPLIIRWLEIHNVTVLRSREKYLEKDEIKRCDVVWDVLAPDELEHEGMIAGMLCQETLSALLTEYPV